MWIKKSTINVRNLQTLCMVSARLSCKFRNLTKWSKSPDNMICLQSLQKWWLERAITLQTQANLSNYTVARIWNIISKNTSLCLKFYKQENNSKNSISRRRDIFLTERRNFSEDEMFHDGGSRKVNKKNWLVEAKNSLTTKTRLSSICWRKIQLRWTRCVRSYLSILTNVSTRCDELARTMVICWLITL